MISKDHNVSEVSIFNILKVRSKNNSRIEILPAFLITIVIAILLMLGMLEVQPTLIAAAEKNNLLFPFAPDWIEGMNSGNLFYRFMWFIGDWTNGIFITSVPASLGMLGMALVGYILEKKKSKWAGTGVGGNSKVFIRLLTAQLLALILCQVFYSPLLAVGFVPTLAPMFSVTPALIMTFGADNKNG